MCHDGWGHVRTLKAAFPAAFSWAAFDFLSWGTAIVGIAVTIARTQHYGRQAEQSRDTRCVIFQTVLARTGFRGCAEGFWVFDGFIIQPWIETWITDERQRGEMFGSGTHAPGRWDERRGDERFGCLVEQTASFCLRNSVCDVFEVWMRVAWGAEWRFVSRRSLCIFTCILRRSREGYGRQLQISSLEASFGSLAWCYYCRRQVVRRKHCLRRCADLGYKIQTLVYLQDSLGWILWVGALCLYIYLYDIYVDALASAHACLTLISCLI